MTGLYDKGFKLSNMEHKIGVDISCVICDTHARVFVKQTKGHTGYYGCDHCIQRGQVRNHKMNFPETDADARSDLQFNEMENEEHHTGHPFHCYLFVWLVNFHLTICI